MNFSRIFGRSRFWVFLAILSFYSGTVTAAKSGPLIAVAANLRFAIEGVARSFYQETGLGVRFAFGSSGNLSRQILQGAPFEMFMSADEEYVFRISDKGTGIGRGKVYAFGRIVTYTPQGSPLQRARFPTGYSSVFDKEPHSRFAIANPKLAPYGRAAKQALLHVGLWKTMQPHLIYGESISQAAQFSVSGSALGGIIAYSQALTPQFAKSGQYQLIPADWHKPIGQRMILLKSAGKTARRFYEYMAMKPARDIFRRFGYVVVEESD